ncbi:hypothetical protein V8C26DRAFT_339831 [Trichoderma gracile]
MHQQDQLSLHKKLRHLSRAKKQRGSGRAVPHTLSAHPNLVPRPSSLSQPRSLRRFASLSLPTYMTETTCMYHRKYLSVASWPFRSGANQWTGRLVSQFRSGFVCDALAPAIGTAVARLAASRCHSRKLCSNGSSNGDRNQNANERPVTGPLKRRPQGRARMKGGKGQSKSRGCFLVFVRSR